MSGSHRVGIAASVSLLIGLTCLSDSPSVDSDVCHQRDSGDCHVSSGSFDQVLFRLSDRYTELGGEWTIQLGPDMARSFKMVALHPPTYVMDDFLTPAECHHLQDLGARAGLHPSVTVKPASAPQRVTIVDVDGDNYLTKEEMRVSLEQTFDYYLTNDDIHNMFLELNMDKNRDGVLTRSELAAHSVSSLRRWVEDLVGRHPDRRSRLSVQAWLYPDTTRDPLLLRLIDRVSALTGLSGDLVRKSDFQVVRYDVNGHYNAHYDSSNTSVGLDCCTRLRTINCRICRFMTVLFYLNEVEGGGETAFPVADAKTFDERSFHGSEAMNLHLSCHSAALVVAPREGRALIWYNHEVDQHTGWLGNIEELSWHGGCPVTRGEKWIANFWIKLTMDRHYDLNNFPG